MKSLGLKGKRRKNEKYHSYKGEVGKIADKLLARDFHAEKPFEKIVTDISQFNVADEKVYLFGHGLIQQRDHRPFYLEESEHGANTRNA